MTNAPQLRQRTISVDGHRPPPGRSPEAGGGTMLRDRPPLREAGLDAVPRPRRLHTRARRSFRPDWTTWLFSAVVLAAAAVAALSLNL